MTLHARATFALCVALLAIFCGCGEVKTIETDLNGYQCTACQAKFYTTKGVYANKCPQCKKADIQDVLAYTCPVDKELTLAPRNRMGANCKKCGTAITVGSFPSETALTSWGATKKSAADVGAH